MVGKLLVVQLKREYWEHRGVFVFLPLVCVLLIATFWLLGIFSDPSINQKDSAGIHSLGPHVHEFLRSDDTGTGYKINFRNESVVGFIIALQQFMGWWFFTLISVFLTLYYCTSCLFSDRKNRDILFWRSMPVSEHLNVLIKVVVAAVTIPVLTLLMNALTSIILLLVLCVWLGDLGQMVAVFQALPLLGNYLFGSIGLVPLLLPLFAWAMLASAYAKRSPFLGATFIPLILLIADRFLNQFLNINIQVYDQVKAYFNNISKVMQISFDDVSNGYVSFSFSYSADLAIYGLIVTVLLGVVIWLRHNRYEI